MIVTKELVDLPGPGQYTDDTKTFGKDTRAYTIGGKQSEKYNSNPGPGSYNEDANITKANNASVRIGSSSRGNIVSKEVLDLPGPGNYSDDSKTLGKDGHKYTFSARHAEKMSDNPGPGQYDGDFSQTKEKTASVRIGSASRANNFVNASNEVGPGMYEAKSSLNGPSYTFSKDGEPVMKSLSPGPGAYTASDSVVKVKTQSAIISKQERVSEFVYSATAT